MKRLTKLAALLLSLVMLLGIFASCGSKNNRTVAFCGDYEILYDELRFQTMIYRENHPDATEEEIKAAVEEALCRQYAILEICKSYLPEKSVNDKDIQDASNEALEGAIEAQGGKSEFKKLLRERYLTKSLMKRMLAAAQMQIELENTVHQGTVLSSATTFSSWLTSGNFVRARRIFFPSTIEGAEAAATYARVAIRSGTSIDSLLTAEKNALSATIYQPDYYFRNLNDTDLELAALSLASVGDVSDVIATDDGFSLLIRVDDDSENLINYQMETAYTRYRDKRMEELVSQAAATLTVTWTDYGKSVSLSDIK